MERILTLVIIFCIFDSVQANVMPKLTLINSRQGLQFGNGCNGFITTIERPSPGFLVMKEIWKDIEEFSGLYQVSTKGRIKSLRRLMFVNRLGKIIKKVSPEKILNPHTNIRGYVHLALQDNGYCKHLRVHRIVAMAFIPNPENKPDINHKNGIKSDNRVENLEWCTPQENIRHAQLNNLTLKGERHGCSKLVGMQVRVIRKTTELTQRELAKIFNVSQPTIKEIKRGEIWKHLL